MKSVLALGLVLAGLQANAAKFQSCVEESHKKCGTITTVFATLATEGTECTMVQEGRSDETGIPYSGKVLFKDSNTLYSIDTDTCNVAREEIWGKFEEVKQLKGRVFARTSASEGGHVYVVARNNQIVLLKNSKGKPYKGVTDMKIDAEAETIAFAFDQSKKLQQPLSLKQIFEKLN